MSVNEKMTAIADEIRELSGTTAAMGLDAMATNVGDANDEIGEQAALMAQIKSALTGKSVSAAGVDVCTINLNWQRLNEETVEKNAGFDHFRIYYTSSVNGIITSISKIATQGVDYTSVLGPSSINWSVSAVCGSVFVWIPADASLYSEHTIEKDDAISVLYDHFTDAPSSNSSNYEDMVIFKVPDTPGNYTITVYYH